MTITSPPIRQRPIIRVFVSSTFSDLIQERNALVKDVWPALERFCRQRGFTFQAIDLRWGVPSEAGLDHRTMQICFEELRRAQETSPEPNFLILLGNKYGWRPLPETIAREEYRELLRHTQSKAERRTLRAWYRRDSNAQPPHYLLRARTDSPDGEDYSRVPDSDCRLQDTAAWLAVQQTLWSIVNRAYPSSLINARRFEEGTDDIPASVRFQGSATEQEIWRGALQVENAREHVVAWFREIDRTGGDPEPSQLKQFIDLRLDQSPDRDAAAALAELKTQVEQKLKARPITVAKCRWARDASGEFTGEVTIDHLASMCEAVLTHLREIILRQINTYWGADLSAEDATIAAVRGTQQELDLELRDHCRFAEERGPVELFVGRDEQVKSIREYLKSTTNHPLIVHGPSGSGKTALLAYVAQRPFLPGSESVGVSPLILTRYIGAHPESSTLRGLMTSLCRELRVHFPMEEPLPDTLQKLIEEFYSQLGRATANRPIYVLLDALDQLASADRARDVVWLRSNTIALAGDGQCHARIVASCLSPSLEFPLVAEACEPFRRLQSRGLLAEQELGALDEAAASLLLRNWLADQQRGLTKEQWRRVKEAIYASSACRQPLYLKVLAEQLRGWPEFKELEPLPESLSLLIQQTLTTLCQPNQHDQLPRIALGYLVSARYGLSEGELLEILVRDPQMQAQLEASAKAYGHQLPPGAERYPVAPWARLRSDLRVYLSERAAPGTTVLYCYHRHVEQAVRTLFLADEATHTKRRQLLADYFDGRWDQPDAHALMELPDLLLALPDYRRLFDRVTNFAFPMRKAEVGLLDSIADGYSGLAAVCPVDTRASLEAWQDFFREQGHILRRGVSDQSVHKILLQLALEHADDSPVTIAAESWLAAGRCDWLRLQRVPRLEHRSRNPCRAVLEGHSDQVRGAMLLDDGRFLSWSDDKTLRLWNAATGASLVVLQGHTDRVSGALSLSADRILSWSSDKTLRVWDSSTGVCLASLEGHKYGVSGAQILSDGRILSWCGDETLRVWNASTGVCFTVLEGHKYGVKGALLLPDGRILSWAADKTLRLWDPATGDCQQILEGHAREVKGTLLLSDGRILSWSEEKSLRVWDCATGACCAVLEGHHYGVSGALLLANGRILSWSSDKTLRLWDSATGACHAVLQGHTDWVIGALSLSADRILSWSSDKTLRVWNAATGACLASLEGHTLAVEGSLLLSDGRIISWSGDGTLRMWNSVNGDCDAILRGHTKWVSGARLLPHGRILSWSGENTLRVWNTTTGTNHSMLEGHTDYVRGVLLPNGRILSWSSDGTLRIWDNTTGCCQDILEGHTDWVIGAISLPNDRILSWSYDNTLRVWNGATGDCISVLKGHTYILGAKLLPNSRIISWSRNGTLRIWDGATGACRAVLDGDEHDCDVNGVVPLADDQIVTWSAWGKTVRIWDAATGVCCMILAGHTETVSGAIPMTDGRILSWSFDKTLRIWEAKTKHSHARRLADWFFRKLGGSGIPLTVACSQILEGHTAAVKDAISLPDGRILSWSDDLTLRLWDSATGVCVAVFEGHTSVVEGAVVLESEAILSWSNDGTLRLWNTENGVCRKVILRGDLLAQHPEWYYRRRLIEKPESVAADWGVDFKNLAVFLFHRRGLTSLPFWQAEADCPNCLLLPDGTLVVRQLDRQVCILKLFHGNRRVSLAEAEAILGLKPESATPSS